MLFGWWTPTLTREGQVSFTSSGWERKKDRENPVCVFVETSFQTEHFRQRAGFPLYLIIADRGPLLWKWEYVNTGMHAKEYQIPIPPSNVYPSQAMVGKLPSQDRFFRPTGTQCHYQRKEFKSNKRGKYLKRNCWTSPAQPASPQNYLLASLGHKDCGWGHPCISFSTMIKNCFSAVSPTRISLRLRRRTNMSGGWLRPRRWVYHPG